MTKRKQKDSPLNDKRLLAVLLVIAAVSFFISLGGPSYIKRLYYGHKAKATLSASSQKLGNPLSALGFSQITKTSECKNILVFGSNKKQLECTASQSAYQVFGTQPSKAKAVVAAKKLSDALAAAGWQRGNYEVGQWFDDVLNHRVDYNPDAFHYKYANKTICILDFFVAYSTPKPAAVQAQFRCSTPEPADPFKTMVK